jgi:DNA invertase Pin-like site-specific DNA recombinase
VKKAVALLRCSTDSQAESGLGLEAQRTSIEQFARATGVHVTHWIVEAGVSGTLDLAERPQLLEALALIQSDGLDHLIVACADRLTRSVLVAELVRAELARASATLLSADGQANDTSPEAELMRRIVQAMAQYEAARIALRTRLALRAKRARGEQVGGSRPFGQQRGEADLLAACYARADAGQDAHAIAADLTRSGFKGRRGAPITHVSVRRWLARRPKQ